MIASQQNFNASGDLISEESKLRLKEYLESYVEFVRNNQWFEMKIDNIFFILYSIS